MLLSSHTPPLLALAVLLVAVPTVFGQDPDTTQLPEIAPREIEIRGERQIDLPSLERQPLTGFSSPARVPAVPPDRTPYVGSYRQTLDALPENLPIPETVSEPMEPATDPAQGFLEGGTGRYLSRFFEGRVGVPLSANDRLSLHGQYTGIENNPDDDVADARAHGGAQRYALFGASPSDSEREAFTAGGAFRLRTLGDRPTRVEMRYDNTEYTSRRDSTSVFSQQQFSLTGSGTLPLPLRPHLDGTLRRSWFGGDPTDDPAFSLDAGGRLTAHETESTTVQAGARVLTYETPTRSTSTQGGTVSATFVAPSVRVEWAIADRTRLHIHNRPRLGDTSLDQLYATNPYAQHAPSLRPTLETTNAEAGLTVSLGTVRLVTAAGYRYAPAYRYFSYDAQSGLYDVRYNSARILQGRGQIALQGIEGVQASLGLSVRDGTLTSRDTEIPSFAPITADAMLAVSFADGDGFLEAQTRFESPRDASLANDRLDSYFTLDLEGTYALGDQAEIVARAEHLSSGTLTLWKNHPRPPAQVSAGLRLNW
ncbi:MAG: hypothetical protein BRD39_01380 [Bacteroidetes bacterium QH_9_64_21]|nr:MAG: hypothetical protein BRD39_01380 [Bacteroidetes bacterium QH_9_64_21]